MTASVTSLAFAGLSQKIVTRTSARAVMAFGMALIGAGMLWAAQAPPHGSFWPDLAGPFFVAGIGTAFAFIPISIGALTGVTERDAGVASGLLSTSQNLGGVIGVAVASSIAALPGPALCGSTATTSSTPPCRSAATSSPAGAARWATRFSRPTPRSRRSPSNSDPVRCRSRSREPHRRPPASGPPEWNRALVGLAAALPTQITLAA